MPGQPSQSVCAKVQILNPKSSINRQDGLCILDPYPGFEIRTTRNLEQLTILNKIQVDEVIPFIVPRTQKNDLELGDFTNPNKASFDFKPIPVIVTVGDQVLHQNLLHVLRCNERDQTYSCELRTDESHWLVGIKKIKCRDLKWDYFDINIDNIEDNWQNNAKYLDGDIGIWWPLAYYGAWFSKGTASFYDMRPYAHVLALAQKIYSKAGWYFRCPFLETDFGRRLSTYLIDPVLETDDQAKRKSSVSVRTNDYENVGNFNGLISLPFEEYDDNSSFDGQYFSAEGIFDLTAILVVNLTDVDPSQFAALYEITLVRLNEQGISENLVSNIIGISPNDTGTLPYLEAKISGVPISIKDKIFIRLRIEDNDYGRYGVIFRANPANSVIFRDGAKLHYPSVLPKDLTGHDVIAGITHLINGKFHTDYVNRTVWLLSPFTTRIFGQETEGYYKENVINDLTRDQNYHSTIVNSVDIEQKRYLRLQFKESTDERIKALNFPKENPPFSRTYDVSDILTEETEVSANPFFEPTITDDVFSILGNPTILGNEHFLNLKLGLPFLVDNSDDKPSYNIAPRILYNAGFVKVKTPENKSIYWKFENRTYDKVPYAFQYTNYLKEDGSPFDRYLMYGTKEQDLFQKFWYRSLFENRFNTKSEIWHQSKPHHHFGWSFREMYKFLVKDKETIGRMIASSDFDGCGKIPTPITLVPASNRELTFLLDPRSSEPACSTQQAKLTVTKTGDTYNFDVDNSAITKVILNQVIRWKYINATSWTVGSSVSSPTGKFMVQLQTSVEGCPDDFKTVVIDPCGANKPAFIFSFRYDAGLNKNCAKVNLGGLLIDTVNTGATVYKYSTVTGGVESADTTYTLNSEICTEADEICFKGLIKFDNDCDPIPIQLCYNFDQLEKPCNLNLPSVQCLNLGIGAYRLALAGSWVSKMAIYFFETRLLGADDNSWVVWDGHEPLFPGEFESRVWMYFCDGCPPVCSEPVVCMEPALGVAPVQSAFNMDNYKWDWSKLPYNKKKEVKDFYYAADWANIMLIHNYYRLSDHRYCCSGEKDGVFIWTKKAIDEGLL